jgi:hypothetical protein
VAAAALLGSLRELALAVRALGVDQPLQLNAVEEALGADDRLGLFIAFLSSELDRNLAGAGWRYAGRVRSIRLEWEVP